MKPVLIVGGVLLVLYLLRPRETVTDALESSGRSWGPAGGQGTPRTNRATRSGLTRPVAPPRSV